MNNKIDILIGVVCGVISLMVLTLVLVLSYSPKNLIFICIIGLITVVSIAFLFDLSIPNKSLIRILISLLMLFIGSFVFAQCGINRMILGWFDVPQTIGNGYLSGFVMIIFSYTIFIEHIVFAIIKSIRLILDKVGARLSNDQGNS